MHALDILHASSGSQFLLSTFSGDSVSDFLDFHAASRRRRRWRRGWSASTSSDRYSSRAIAASLHQHLFTAGRRGILVGHQLLAEQRFSHGRTSSMALTTLTRRLRARRVDLRLHHPGVPPSSRAASAAACALAELARGVLMFGPTAKSAWPENSCRFIVFSMEAAQNVHF